MIWRLVRAWSRVVMAASMALKRMGFWNAHIALHMRACDLYDSTLVPESESRRE